MIAQVHLRAARCLGNHALSALYPGTLSAPAFDPDQGIRASDPVSFPGPRSAQPMNAHRLSVADVLASVRSSPAGLATAEASRRLGEYGPNRVERRARTPALLRLLGEFTQFFSLILWVAAALAF